MNWHWLRGLRRLAPAPKSFAGIVEAGYMAVEYKAAGEDAQTTIRHIGCPAHSPQLVTFVVQRAVNRVTAAHLVPFDPEHRLADACARRELDRLEQDIVEDRGRRAALEQTRRDVEWQLALVSPGATWLERVRASIFVILLGVLMSLSSASLLYPAWKRFLGPVFDAAVRGVASDAFIYGGAVAASLCVYVGLTGLLVVGAKHPSVTKKALATLVVTLLYAVFAALMRASVQDEPREMLLDTASIAVGVGEVVFGLVHAMVVWSWAPSAIEWTKAREAQTRLRRLARTIARQISRLDAGIDAKVDRWHAQMKTVQPRDEAHVSLERQQQLAGSEALLGALEGEGANYRTAQAQAQEAWPEWEPPAEVAFEPGGAPPRSGQARSGNFGGREWTRPETGEHRRPR
jgi:hypothetical protein